MLLFSNLCAFPVVSVVIVNVKCYLEISVPEAWQRMLQESITTLKWEVNWMYMSVIQASHSSSHLYILYCDESIVLKVSDVWIALKSILKSIYRYFGYPSPWWWQPGCWLFVSAVCTIQRCFFLNSPHFFSPHICPGVTWGNSKWRGRKWLNHHQLIIAD